MAIHIVILMVILAIPLIPTFWAILDIPKRQFVTPKQKLVWFFTVSTLPCVGAILYILFGRRSTTPLAELTAPPVPNEVSQH
jgi:hypothetical protein